MLSKPAVLALAVLGAAICCPLQASSLVPMGSEIGASQLAGIEPGATAPNDRIGPPPAPAAAQRAAEECPDAPAHLDSTSAPSAPDGGVSVKIAPRVKPAREWRWKALLPGALK